jgi:DNA-directed RNA polymerase subunit RPC12/RpoP
MLLRREEAATFLGVTPTELLAMVEAGTVRMVRVGPLSPRFVVDRPDEVRQARGKDAPKRVSVGPEQRARIIARDGIQCRYCGAETSGRTRHMDHLISVRRGGSNDDSNIVVTCQRCNNRKMTKSVRERKMTLRPSPGATPQLNAYQQALANGQLAFPVS